MATGPQKSYLKRLINQACELELTPEAQQLLDEHKFNMDVCDTAEASRRIDILKAAIAAANPADRGAAYTPREVEQAPMGRRVGKGRWYSTSTRSNEASYDLSPLDPAAERID